MSPAKRTEKAAPSAADGLASFSMHAYDESSSDLIATLRSEEPDYPQFAMAPSETTSAIDPETVARRYLDQALDSTSVPAFTTPETGTGATEFVSLGTETIPLTDTKTVKFRQTVDRIPLYGSLITVELDEDNSLVSLSSVLGNPQGVNSVAKVSPAEAVKIVAKHPGYRKQVDNLVPRLHYYFDAKPSRWRLVYILEDVPVEVGTRPATKRPSAHEPPHFMDYVVDAHTGKVVAELPRTPSMASKLHEAPDGLGVMRKIRVETKGRTSVLKDATYNVETYDLAFGDPTIVGIGMPGKAVKNPPKWTPAAVSAHANAVAVAEFLRTELRRNNIDNRGGALVSTINCVVAAQSRRPKEWLNAFWSPDLRQMVYGQAIAGNGFRSLAVNIDIVAHEIFHGITDSTSRLEYALQPGALNESYSDIFGIIVSNLLEPDPRRWDWELGEGLLDGGVPFRDLSKPERFDQPAHMDDFRVLPNTRAGDWGGVHINSGIHNKAAHNMLIATDAADELVLTRGEVSAVFYLALTQHLSRTSQFADSRRAVVTSARTLLRRRPAAERNRKLAAIERAFTDVGIT